ncbi:hypothetical protein F2P81_009052 [Scophthalmus maximus]|uniref:Uncharacterized protein n=1 Tax=Scophthalmus maximus TaxID=52904 RepID=A0A6A4T2K4_SCOMX|nr:hypothetical protein F2P81_009052 [Scophthalmus maximus]
MCSGRKATFLQQQQELQIEKTKEQANVSLNEASKQPVSSWVSPLSLYDPKNGSDFSLKKVLDDETGQDHFVSPGQAWSFHRPHSNGSNLDDLIKLDIVNKSTPQIPVAMATQVTMTRDTKTPFRLVNESDTSGEMRDTRASESSVIVPRHNRSVTSNQSSLQLQPQTQAERETTFRPFRSCGDIRL